MMLGLIPLTSGEIRIDGARSAGGDFRAVRRTIGYLPENVVLYDNLTGLETLHFFSRLKGVHRHENVPAALERVGLAHAAKRRVREYSKGMRQRLGFAQALLGKPHILFLDEPTSGLDPEAIRELLRDPAPAQRRGRDDGDHLAHPRRDPGAGRSPGDHDRRQDPGHAARCRPCANRWICRCGSTCGVAAGAFRRGARRARPSAGERHRGPRRSHRPCSAGAKPRWRCSKRLPRWMAGCVDLNVREPSLEDVFFGFSD